MSKLNISQNSRAFRLGLALAFGLALLIGLLLAMGAAHPPDVALAQGPTTRYVAPAPTGNDSSNGCITSSTPCATVQHAVDVADPGDEIRVANGTYTDVQARAGITQVVYVSKTVTLRGGYTSAFTAPPDPEANPTTLDAQGEGRVLYITGDLSTSSGQAISPTVEGLRITGGDAAGLGGASGVAGAGADAGGGVYVITATVTLSSNHVFSNTARNGGGAFFYKSHQATLIDNIFSDNTTNNLAAGLYFRNSSGATLTANTISNNKAGSSGGQQHYGGARFENSDNVTLIGNTISGNHADNQCGGICFTSGSDNATLIGNNIVGNSAGMPGTGYVNSEGGGLSFVSSTNANLTSNTISDNRSTTFGGGLYLSRSDITMTNNVVVDNQITMINNFTGSSSGLYIAGSSPRLLHTTIARNSGGDGSGIYITDAFGAFTSTVALTNTILVSHTVGITVTADNIAILNGVLWYSNTKNYGGLGTIIVTNEYTGNPAFAADGYHLTFPSEAIDKGVDAGVTTDIDGYQRPCGLAPDLGADEITCLYLPMILKNSNP